MNSHPNHVIIGPLTKQILARATWKPHNQFPAHQCWADEFERALQMLDKEGVLSDFVDRLSMGERGVWAEVWAAYYFDQQRFRFCRWQPEYVAGRPGDMEVSLDNSSPVFVEVKRPGWQGELSSEELDTGRADRPKYINAEVRSFDNVTPIMYSLRKALPKLREYSANIIVVVDDMFVSPLETHDSIFRDQFRAALHDCEFMYISGVLLLKPVLYTECVEYLAYFQRALGPELPHSVQEFFDQVNQETRWNS
ncbi:MAG: hypothetical protein GY835_05030 [bacterium]|nr:hypothetical protein [bacterium]